MNDKHLYEQILGITKPWHVSDVVMELGANSIIIKVEHSPTAQMLCPVCNTAGSIHDHRVRRWRHLPTCHLRTIIEARVPRVNCPEHGTKQMPVPWADSNGSFTALFEALVIRWLQEASIAAVARLMDLTWDQVDGIRTRAVTRGLARRKSTPTSAIGVDETSFKKRHDYVSVVTDQTSGDVQSVLDDRKQATLQAYFESLPMEHREALDTIAMDMWDPYIAAVRESFPNWQSLICFDRFHVAQHFGKALDKTRATEHRALIHECGDSILKSTKHDWLRNSNLIDNRSRRWFTELTRVNLKTSRAWAIKETAARLWHYICRGHAQRAWERLISWMKRSRLPHVVKLSKTVQRYLWGIINAIVNHVSNAKSEAMNSRIQQIKKTACGFRNRERFKNAILFHLGGLDLLPDQAKCSHTIS